MMCDFQLCRGDMKTGLVSDLTKAQNLGGPPFTKTVCTFSIQRQRRIW